jgi:hypothetical protein
MTSNGFILQTSYSRYNTVGTEGGDEQHCYRSKHTPYSPHMEVPSAEGMAAFLFISSCLRNPRVFSGEVFTFCEGKKVKLSLCLTN